MNLESIKRKDLLVKHRNYYNYINPHMLESQNAWKNLKRLRELIYEKLEIEYEMLKTNDVDLLYLFDKLYDIVELEIQDCFNFKKDFNNLRFWRRPKCLCPKMDNADLWGTSMKVINNECPLHGDGR